MDSQYAGRSADFRDLPRKSTARADLPLCQARLLSARIAVGSSGPEPGGAPDTTGIAVTCGTEARSDPVRKDKAMPYPGHVPVQAPHVRKSATQDDHLGIQDIDDLRQGARQPVFVTLQNTFRACVPLLCQGRHRLSIRCGGNGEIAGEAGSGKEGFNTAVFAAIAGRPGQFSFLCFPRR